MKKSILTLLLVLVLLFALPLVTSAEEVATEVPSEGTADEAIIESPVSLFDRLFEFYNENKTEIITTLGEFISLIILAVAASLWQKITKQSSHDIKEIKTYTIDSSRKQDQTIKAYNEVVESFNGQAEAYKNVQSAFEDLINDNKDLHEAVLKLSCEVKAILDIIYTVDINSRLPQGLKDLVTLKYCKCLKETDSKSGAEEIADNTSEVKINAKI